MKFVLASFALGADILVFLFLNWEDLRQHCYCVKMYFVFLKVFSYFLKTFYVFFMLQNASPELAILSRFFIPKNNSTPLLGDQPKVSKPQSKMAIKAIRAKHCNHC